MHYLSMARGQRDLLGARELVRRKRYLYILRPLLAVRLIARGTWPPPMALSAIMQSAALQPDVAAAVAALVAGKQAGSELGEGARVPVRDDWIAEALRTADPQALPEAGRDRDAQQSIQRCFLETLGLGHLLAP